MPPQRFWFAVTLEAAAVVLLSALLLDVHSHRRVETTTGVNQWGFRGPLRTTPEPGDVRVAIIGGSAAFAAGIMWWDTMPARLASALNAPVKGSRGRPTFHVDNLAEPGAGAQSYVQALRDYGYLDPDVVCLFDGYDAAPGAVPPEGRRASIVFRLTGYLPGTLRSVDRGLAPVLKDGPFDPVLDPSCSGASASYCLAMTDTVRFALQQQRIVVAATPPYVSARHEIQQRSLAQRLDREFGREPRFRYVDLGRDPDPAAQAAKLASEVRDVLARR